MRRSRRRELPHRDRPIGQGHVRHLQAARRSDSVFVARRSIPTCSRIRSRASGCGRWRGSPSPARTGTRRTRRRFRRGTIWRAPSFSASSIRGDGVSRRYPISDNSLPARYARAIATYRFGNLRPPCSRSMRLIQAQPQQSLFSRAQGPSAARSRPGGGRRRPAAAGRAARAQPRADPDHARPGAAGVQQQGACR